MNTIATRTIQIIAARYLKNYQIEFEFDDQTKKVVDFENFLNQVKNPMIKKYLDLTVFKNFTLRDGDIDWNDYELCFPIADIYEGDLWFHSTKVINTMTDKKTVRHLLGLSGGKDSAALAIYLRDKVPDIF